MTPGLYLLHKPVGPTSFSLVQECIESARKLQPTKRPRVCHGGTLDPFAHGLLIMLVGPATRLFDYLHGVPKTYEATVRWGVETDNGDLLGKTTLEGDPSSLSQARLDEALTSFVGWQEQIPHATSNKRVGGERAYVRAHRGENVEMPPSRVYLHEATWLGHELGGASPMSKLRLVARRLLRTESGAGLGRAMGCGAHLSGLHRVAIGPYVDPGPGARAEVRGREVLPWCASKMLSDQDVGDLRQGRTIPAIGVVEGEWKAPAGFPEAAAPVRGFHREKLMFLMEIKEGWMGAVANLGAGIERSSARAL